MYFLKILSHMTCHTRTLAHRLGPFSWRIWWAYRYPNARPLKCKTTATASTITCRYSTPALKQ